jgi:hypothetical protein
MTRDPTPNVATEPEFFREGELIKIPKSLADPIERWCKQAQLTNTSLPSKRAVSDEPLDVHYIPLASKQGQGEIKA